MRRKREKPYPHRQEPYSQPKRRRPPPPPPDSHLFDDDSSGYGVNMQPERSAPRTPSTVMVIGISQDCSMLDVKSRFEIYGSISRTTILPDGVAYVTFRSKDAAESAISASTDPSFGITLDSNKVQVIWADDPAPQIQWRAGVVRKDGLNSSKLLRGEIPLSRHGKGHNRLGSMIVNPRGGQSSYSGGMKMALKGREMVAYDDIV